MLVGLVLTGIWLLFPDFVVKAGPHGLFLKLALALPYFAIFNSRICDGQTFGKRWMDVQVVDGGGATISLGKSILRSLALFVPYFIGLDVAGRATLAWPLSAIVAALAIIANGTFYLLIFNRQTRQGIHDIVRKTYVAECDLLTVPVKDSFWKLHWVIYGSLAVAGLLLDHFLR